MSLDGSIAIEDNGLKKYHGNVARLERCIRSPFRLCQRTVNNKGSSTVRSRNIDAPLLFQFSLEACALSSFGYGWQEWPPNFSQPRWSIIRMRKKSTRVTM
jgi:hypothetical protein